MLQRIQTIYLLIAEILTVSLLFSKVATFLTSDGSELVLKYNGLYEVNGNIQTKIVNAWPMASLVIISAVIGFLIIFLYRHRLLQIRVCFFNMVMNFGVLVLFAYYIYSISVVGKSTFVFSIIDVFPLFSIVLYYLAYRGIAKDYATVMVDSFRVRTKK